MPPKNIFQNLVTITPTIINASLKFMEKVLLKLGKDIQSGFSKEMSGVSSVLEKTTKQQSVAFIQSVNRLQKAIDKIKEPKFSGDIKVDTNKLETTIQSLKSSFKPVKVDKLETLLKSIQTALKDNSNAQLKSFKDGLEAIVIALNQLNLIVPNTFKLDEMQLRALKPQGGGYGGILPARSTKITNVIMTSADTEYSHTFNKSCVSFRMKLRVNNASFYYSWETGTLKVSGDASSYISIPANWLDSRDGVEYNGKTIFFEHSSASSQIMEIEEGIA